MPAGEPILKREKLRKTLAHKKMRVVVTFKNRVVRWEKLKKLREKNIRTSTNNDKWLSRLRLKNRVG